MDDLLSTIQSGNPNAQAQTSAPAAPAPASQPAAQPAGFDPSKSYGTPSKLLDNLIHTESSGNPYAVNDKTGAMGPYQFTPSTIAMLRKQGVAFDPFDPQQSRNAADYYIQQLKGQNGGTYQGALKAYGGFVHADPTPYINKVMAGVPAAPTVPGQSNSGQQPSGYTGPMSDLFSTIQQGAQPPQAAKQPAQAPQQPNQPQQQPSALSRFGQSAVALGDTVLGAPIQALNAAATNVGYAALRPFTTPERAMQIAGGGQDVEDTNHPVSTLVNAVRSAFGDNSDIRNTPGYRGEATQQATNAVGNVANKGIAAVSNVTGVPQQDVANMAGSLSLAVPGAAKAVGRTVAPAVRNVASTIGDAAVQTAAEDAAASGRPIPGLATGRGSVGAAGASFEQQARAEGVPDPIVQRIAQQEQQGTLNPTAAERHIEAGSLPVPIELTAGQATGDVNLLSQEQNLRGKNPDLALRFNAQNGQIADNLTALRDQVSPNVNVPSGAPTGQALVDAYKEMDAPIQQHISDLYAQARGADGAPALVNSAQQMRDFANQIGPTRFNALPANVQQIFRDATANQVSLPAGFEINGSSFRPMNVGDLMDIDKTLSGAMRSATDGTVRHDIGALRDSIVNSDLDPSSAGADAFSAYRTAQASARARFQAMDADPAYKAAVNDMTPVGEPSALADDFARKYIAGGKTANVQNMMQNLSNDPVNRELVASALMDHIRAQAGVDLRTGAGNISQSGLNKAIQNLGDKTRIVLGPQASQTVEKLGNVARYTQEQPRGSFVNNSNTFVAGAAEAGKSALEGIANRAAFGVPVGTWARQGLAKNSLNKQVRRSLEPGAGVQSPGVPLNRLIRNNTGP